MPHHTTENNLIMTNSIPFLEEYNKANYIVRTDGLAEEVKHILIWHRALTIGVASV